MFLFSGLRVFGLYPFPLPPKDTRYRAGKTRGIRTGNA